MPTHREVNNNFFKTWTPKMSYVLGFFAADGNLIKNKRGACFLSFQICDLDILLEIQSFIGSNHTVGVRIPKGNEKYLYRLQIGSKEIYKDLKALGFQESKTFNMCIPGVPDIYFADFVRGYFDGDGNVWSSKIKKRLQVAFTSSSKSFLEGLFTKLKNKGIKGGSLTCHDTFCRLSYGTRDSLKIYSFMYNRGHYNLPYLSRKKEVFDRFIVDSNRVAAVAQR